MDQLLYFFAVSRQHISLVENISWQTWGVDIALEQDRKDILLCLLCDSKLLMFLFTGRDGGEMHFYFNCCIPGVRFCVNFLQGKCHIWKCSCDWNHYLIRWVIIDCHSPWYIWLYTIQIGILNRDVVGISTLAYFTSLMVALIFVIPVGVWCCFVLLLRQVRFEQVQFQCFLLGPSPITVLPPWIGEPMWELRQLFLVSVPSMCFELREITAQCTGGELG